MKNIIENKYIYVFLRKNSVTKLTTITTKIKIYNFPKSDCYIFSSYLHISYSCVS